MEILYILIAVIFINCIYYFLFSKFAFSEVHKKPKSGFPVSLLICAKNEAKNLENHLPLWLAQNHPNYEIILINDASIDDSLEVMEKFAAEDARIKIVNVENNEAFWGSKKYALTLGIKRAKNEHLIFTDADCHPASTEWLSLMASEFSKKKQLVLGYGGYLKQKGFLNALIRFETLMTAAQYFSYAKIGIPYMGVGRNLGYTASVYYRNRGFINHIKIASGDDDLFVNETATAENTAICIAPEAFTYSLPKTTRKEWVRQKKRHYSTAKFYKSKHKLLLGGYSFSIVLFWVLLPIAFFSAPWLFVASAVFVRFLMQYSIIGKIAGKLRETSLIPWIPFLEFVLILSQLSIFISNSSEKNRKWK